MDYEVPQTGQFVRASSFPDFNDCARRCAARNFRGMIEAAGYRIRTLFSTVGASVGSSVHAGAKFMMDAKLNTGELGNASEADMRSLETMKEEIDKECMWDRTTGDANTAEQQILRMLNMFREDAAPTIEPYAVEERLEADLGDGFTVSGRKDMLCRLKDGIRDLKTGTIQRANGGQYGAYSLIDRAHGRVIETVSEIFIPRATLKKPQPHPTFIDYEIAACEHLAAATMRDMKASIIEFQNLVAHGGAEPSSAFRANPLSMLCGEKYCPAFNTNFCRVHKKGKDSED